MHAIGDGSKQVQNPFEQLQIALFTLHLRRKLVSMIDELRGGDGLHCSSAGGKFNEFGCASPTTNLNRRSEVLFSHSF